MTENLLEQTRIVFMFGQHINPIGALRFSENNHFNCTESNTDNVVLEMSQKLRENVMLNIPHRLW